MSEETGTVQDRDRYNAAVQLIVVSEITSWNRFYIFLVFVTILILAWVQLFSQQARPAHANFVMATLCVLGIAISLVWAGLGQRGRDYVQTFRRIAARLEDPSEGAQNHQSKNPCAAADPTQYTPQVCCVCRLVVSLTSSYTVLVILPVVILLLFIALFIVTLV